MAQSTRLIFYVELIVNFMAARKLLDLSSSKNPGARLGEALANAGRARGMYRMQTHGVKKKLTGASLYC
jgi:hypothetical protein